MAAEAACGACICAQTGMRALLDAPQTHYQIQNVLHAGSKSTLRKARNRATGETVAIKTCKTERDVRRACVHGWEGEGQRVHCPLPLEHRLLPGRKEASQGGDEGDEVGAG